MSELSPKLSIVTVCYNAAETLERTLASVDSQKYMDFEHIIVDGGSEDGSLELLDKHAKPYRSVYSGPDSGIYDAMNKGIALSKGDYIHFLNADDSYSSVKSVSEAMSQVKIDQLNFFEVNLVASNGVKTPYGVGRGKVDFRCCYIQPGWVIPRVIYNRTGKFDISYRIAGDYDYLLRMLRLYPYEVFDRILVDMSLGGISNTQAFLGFRETREASVRNGISPAKAYFSWLLKCLNIMLKSVKW